MPRPRSGYLELALAWTVAFVPGCGLVDDDKERSAAASWCDEAGSHAVAEVTLEEHWEDGVTTHGYVTLTDGEGRTLVTAQIAEDGSVHMRTDFVLDDEGHVLEARSDEDGDGAVDFVSTTTYDDEGRPLVTSFDVEGDGRIDRIATWDYATPGQAVRGYDRDADGEPDSIYTASYDESERLIREEIDGDADGVAEQVKTTSYTESGQLLEVTEEDEQGREVTTYEYDSADRLIRRTFTDEEAESTSVTEDTFEYDEAGLLVAMSTDFDRDGVPEPMERLTYDAEGRLVRREVLSGAGTVRLLYEFEYGEGTEAIRITLTDVDGDWDWVMTRTACA